MRHPALGTRIALATTAILLVCETGEAAAQDRTILGQVTDSRTGHVLSVGEVSVIGTQLSDSLRPDGLFLMRVPRGEVRLRVSSLEYRTKYVSVAPDRELANVELQVDALQVEGLVVSGYATEIQRKHLANAVASLASTAFNTAPATTWEEMLHGKVAGLQIKQASAAPGGSNLLRLRGISSIFGNNTPLFVLDGVVVSDARIDGGMNAISLAEGRDRISGTSHDGLPNRIADLNPNDIETIEILRSAAATMMYGSRGANGVVLIKTKRGG